MVLWKRFHNCLSYLSYTKYIRYYSTKPSGEPTINYCLDLVRKNDHENFLCALLLPLPARNAIIAIRAFNVEVSKAAVASKDIRISQMRLGFWNETLDRIYDGNPPKHPVALELARAVSKHDLKKRHLIRMIKARELQLSEQCFESLEKMETYAEETVSSVIFLSLEAAGIKNIHADHAASHVGKGQGLTMLLRVAGTSGESWCLPRDLLKSIGISPGKGLVPHSPSNKDLIFKIASRAKAHVDKEYHQILLSTWQVNKARALKSSLPSGTSVHLLPAIPTYEYLYRLGDVDFDIFYPILNESNFRLGFSLLWAKLINSY